MLENFTFVSKLQSEPQKVNLVQMRTRLRGKLVQFEVI